MSNEQSKSNETATSKALPSSSGYTIPDGISRQYDDIQTLCDWLDKNKSCRFVDELRNELTKRNDEWCGRDETY